MNLNTYYWGDENGVPWNTGVETDYLRAVTAEMNRLAQREADLVHQVEDLQAELEGACARRDLEIERARRECATARELLQDHHAAGIEVLKFDLAAARSANDLLGGKINRLEADTRVLNEALIQAEHREGLWKDSAEKAQSRADAFQRALKAAEARVRDLEANRIDGSLLVKQAARIAELEARVEALQGEVNFQEAEIVGHRSRLVERENALSPAKETAKEWERKAKVADVRGRQYCLEVIVLRAAIDAGIAHVGKARQAAPSAIGQWPDQTVIEQLDLAHEVLSKASAVWPEPGAPPRAQAPPLAVDPAKPGAERTVYRAVVIEKRRHEGTGSQPAHFYACGPVRESLIEAVTEGRAESVHLRVIDLHQRLSAHKAEAGKE